MVLVSAGLDEDVLPKQQEQEAPQPPMLSSLRPIRKELDMTCAALSSFADHPCPPLAVRCQRVPSSAAVCQPRLFEECKPDSSELDHADFETACVVNSSKLFEENAISALGPESVAGMWLHCSPASCSS